MFLHINFHISITAFSYLMIMIMMALVVTCTNNTNFKLGSDIYGVDGESFSEAVFTLQHTPICWVCNGIDMWWNFVALLPLVQFNNFFCVDRELLVWVHNHTKQSRVCLKNEKENFFLYLPICKPYRQACKHVTIYLFPLSHIHFPCRGLSLNEMLVRSQYCRLLH